MIAAILMKSDFRELCGAALGVLLLLTPIRNPDLPWHLSAGQRIAETHAIPAADWLSWTRPGAAWVDFEWAVELLYHFTYRLGGFCGLLALKAAVLAALMAVYLLLLRTLELPPSWRGAMGLALALGMSPYADLRPDHFSLLFFAAQLWLLERARQGRTGPGWKTAAAHAVLYALWANLHPAFVLGLALIGLYAAGGALEKSAAWRWRGLASWAGAGLLGSCATPQGARIFPVILKHAQDMDVLARLVVEWKPASLAVRLQWPFWGLLFATAALLARGVKRKGPRRLPLLFSAAAFGAAALLHARNIPYFCLVALPAAGTCLQDDPIALGAWTRRALLGCAAAALCAFAAHRIQAGLGRRCVSMDYYPEELCRYLEPRAAALGKANFFHTWDWGGYLGWRLAPGYKVFYDGRYIFHRLLGEVVDAEKSPDSWGSFLAQRDIGLISQARGRVGTRGFQLRSGRTIQRPAERLVFPAERWALLYWDSRVLLYARRDALDRRWLDGNEYRWLYPNDWDWLSEQLALGRVKDSDIDAEVSRYMAGEADPEEKARVAAWAASDYGRGGAPPR